ncbi:MAG: ABC transporter ATP-binding protein [Planctomycetes bacterium]|nr:ABC transporter ATP-binding protein [Planctomycetota bacterium]
MVSPLRLRDVTVRYPGTALPALCNAEFEAVAGELHAVIGRNGSGKSTLLRAAAGLVRTTAGQVELAGEDAARLRPAARARRVALVPQGLDALPDCSVAEFVEGGRYAWRGSPPNAGTSDRAAVAAALTATGLLAFAERPLAALSGGERQRALVARALAQDSPVLLGDEPTASLDPDQQLVVLELFAARARAGRAVVVVTHDLDLAGQFADRITMLASGRVADSGAPAQLLTEARLAPVFGTALRVVPGTGAAHVVVERARTTP